MHQVTPSHDRQAGTSSALRSCVASDSCWSVCRWLVLIGLLSCVVVVMAAGVVGASTVEDDDIVVTEDGTVGTGTFVDESELPDSPFVTTESGDDLTVSDGRVVNESGVELTVDGNPVQVRSSEPDLIVNDGSVKNDTLSVDESTGDVVSDTNERQVTADGDDVEYPDVDTVNLSLEITDVNEPGENETLEVGIELENTEFGTFEDDVTLSLIDEDGSTRWVETDQDVTVGRMSTETRTIDNQTEDGDHQAESVTVSVPSEGVSDTEPVTIEEAMVHVDILEVNQPGAGDDLEVETEIRRPGDDGRSFDDDLIIDFIVDGTTQRATTVDPGSLPTTETFTYETSADDGESVDVQVESLDDQDTTEARIITESELADNVEVEFVDRNWPDEGESLKLTGSIGYLESNDIPDEDRSYPIALHVDGEAVDETELELTEEELFDENPINETFTYETEQGDAPRVDAELRGPSRTDRAQPRVNGSDFDIDLVSIDNPVNESDELEAVVEVENTGDAAGSQDLRLHVDNTIAEEGSTRRSLEDQANVSLGVGDVATERLRYEPTAADAPEFDAIISTADDEVTERVTVNPADPFFTVSEASASFDPEDETVTMIGVINNTGLEEDEQFIEYRLDDEVATIEQLALDPWEPYDHEVTAEAPEDGTYNLSVVTQNETYTEPDAVTVERSPTQAADDDDTDDSSDDVEESDDTGVAGVSEVGRFDVESPVSMEQLAVGVGGVLLMLVALFAYRRGLLRPTLSGVSARLGGIRSQIRSRSAGAVAVVRSGDWRVALGTVTAVFGLGGRTLYVHNELPRETTVEVRCETADDTVLAQDLQLGPDERVTIGSLPDADQFTVGAGVDDITDHEEVFQGASGDVGVVLKAEGILIATFR